MITTFTSMKGGTGKTTITGLFASYLTQALNKRVVIVDIDPQGGSTTLFLGIGAREIIDGKKGISVYNILETVRENNNARSIIQQSLQKAPSNPNIFVIPADYRVTSIMSLGETPELLRYALEDASFSDDVVILVDTGTAPFLVSMAICATSDIVFVPLMLSMQNRKPTADTIQLVLRHRKKLGGIVPVGIGSAKWEEVSIASWAERLQSQPLLAGSRIITGIPYSKTLVHSEWVEQQFPERLLPTFKELSGILFNNNGSSQTAPAEAPAAD